MAISKTNFINYTRCPKYIKYENIKEERLSSNLSLEEYLKEEENEKVREILSSIYEINETEEIDTTQIEDPQLTAMMDYYKKVEILAGKHIEKYFKGKTIYGIKTHNQESFDFINNAIRYICYVDIYNEQEDEINIIEVKATTSNKYLKKDMFYGKRNTKGKSYPKYSLFEEKNGIFYISKVKEKDSDVIKSYENKINKLKNRFTDEGKYIYDLAVQRYIIENDLKKHNINKKVNYYLAVLNHEYIYDGESDYEKDENGNEIIRLFNFNEITNSMMPIIINDKNKLESYLKEENKYPTKFSIACELNKKTQCKYKKECYKKLPSINASFNYINFRSFKKDKTSMNKYDLLNEGYYKLDDIPLSWLTNKNHIIQRQCYDEKIEYIDKEKIIKGLNELKYPIYHLDFETFPCPIPRFKGESPYTQSPFEFSLHIENEAGICDIDKDNYVFLAKSENDEREELVKELIKRIDTSKGCMLAQNVSFECSVIKNLAVIFPQYKEKLLKISEMGFDLIWILKTNEKLYTNLGYSKEEATKINFYNNNLSGSYSIKKTLPVFTKLSYDSLDISNGTQALVEYSKFHTMDKKTLDKTRKNLIKYCKQDTWAMVEILKSLRKKVK